ncbi:MAG TPA: type II toxin-antitoxin system VapC family toxin [Anaerolineales bacterium]|nr:type II toxin-antitoxin system VapC family toxin [Anaerolineales bacterium]
MIVVDTNIIGYLYLAGERAPQAERAYQKDPYWAAPVLWRSELQNVLALYLRRRILSLSDAIDLMDSAAGLVSGREYQVPSISVLQLVAQSDCTAYDCEFVALAIDLKIPLVTVDQLILDQFPQAAISLDAFAGPP